MREPMEETMNRWESNGNKLLEATWITIMKETGRH